MLLSRGASRESEVCKYSRVSSRIERDIEQGNPNSSLFFNRKDGVSGFSLVVDEIRFPLTIVKKILFAIESFSVHQYSLIDSSINFDVFLGKPLKCVVFLLEIPTSLAVKSPDHPKHQLTLLNS